MNTILILGVCLSVALAYPTGPPTSACSSMIPGHGDPTVTGPPPYEITVGSSTYATGAPVQVTISGDSETQFRGFFVQARVNDAQFTTNPALGVFSDFPASTGGVDCSNSDSGWGHTDNTDKNSVMANWTYTGECEDVGNLAFRITVVQGNPPTRYWTDIVTENLRFDKQMCVAGGGAGFIISSFFTIASSIIVAVLLAY
ncbi:putative defense protein 2 [Anneissia japonica]|uniref:putative defense protein 2 n=1 Tax=Anneissia japonica TaxID=1529436 RepID=UPI00142576DB|nr:putative defense protein 2 [Anneissia japonica]XP_033097830.1 putative defense protein 2 [Anneissia japonica]